MRSFVPALILCCILMLWQEGCFAVKVHGRLTFGGYTATERFADEATGSDKNDFMVMSGRIFLKVSEIGTTQWESVTDLRDKHDFFDKLDRERLQLDEKNTFQVRQLSLRNSNPNGFLSGTVGRFPIQEAGAVQLDGAFAEFQWGRNFKTGLFAGKNAKLANQTYAQYNPDANQYGLTSVYEGHESSWDKNIYLTHSFVNQLMGNELDRSYFFQNLIYQWEERSRIITILYLDFVPRTYVQTGSALWQQGVSKYFSTQLTLLAIDTIEYTRRQSVREMLAPSPYRSAQILFELLSTPLAKWQLGASHGERSIDQLNRDEVYLGFEKNQIFSRATDFFAKVGTRKNFISDDQFAHVFLGYFSRQWESGLDLDYSLEKYADGVIKHGTGVEISLSNYLSKEFFSTVSLQREGDETVTIWTAFFKVGYRFGNQAPPPIRDGSPPRGQL